MEHPSSEPCPNYEELLAQVADLTAQLAAALERLRAAEAEIAELKRRGPGGAAPFSKGAGKPDPKKAGRKRGEGPFRRREAPEGASPAQALEVPVEQVNCACGGALAADGYEFVTTVDIPPLPQPEVKSFRMAWCRCIACGRRVRAQHPEVPPDQREPPPTGWGNARWGWLTCCTMGSG